MAVAVSLNLVTGNTPEPAHSFRVEQVSVGGQGGSGITRLTEGEDPPCCLKCYGGGAETVLDGAAF